MPKFPILKKGPCGSSLKSASLFFAWFTLIITQISIVSVLSYGKLLVKNMESPLENTEDLKNLKTSATAKDLIEILIYVAAGLLVGVFIFNICLLVGLYKENTCLIYSYICVKGTILGFGFLGSIETVFIEKFSSDTLCYFFWICIEWCVLYIIVCYYKQLKNASNAANNANEGA